MADLALKHAIARAPTRDVSAWDRLKVNRHWLGLWFMLPAEAFRAMLAGEVIRSVVILDPADDGDR